MKSDQHVTVVLYWLVVEDRSIYVDKGCWDVYFDADFYWFAEPRILEKYIVLFHSYTPACSLILSTTSVSL